MKYIALFLLIVLAIFYLFPIYWLVNTSFKTYWEAFAQPPTFLPNQRTTEAWIWLFKGDALKWIKDSFIIASLATIAAISIGTSAGYSFSRFPKYVGGDKLIFWILTTRMFPPIVSAFPMYFLFSKLQILDTYWVLIISYLTFSLPLVIWLMRGFFNSLPKAYEEAAYLEGCSIFQVFRKISLPLVLPGLIATTALTWIFSWNEFLFALVLVGQKITPFPPLMQTIASGFAVYWHKIAALSLFTMGISMCLIIIFRKQLVTGLSLGIISEK